MLGARLAGVASRAGLASAALLGLFLAGCDEHVQIIRDPDIKILKHATWAWRPIEAPRSAARDGRIDRPMISRDVVGRRDAVVQENDPATEIDRRQVKGEIERQLTTKGLTQI